MLWLSLYLPYLPLEVIARGLADPAAPLAIYERHSGRAHVTQTNRAAARYGITEHMPVAGAEALCDRLHLALRDTEREQQALHALAAWAGQFTSYVSLEPPDGLLLEIGGSVRLFGVPAQIRQRVIQGIDALGYRARSAIAPTPASARLFSSLPTPVEIQALPPLARHLDALPVSLWRTNEELQTALRGIGVRTLGEARALPRAGLARRFGTAFVDDLDRLYGLRRDLPGKHLPPDVFMHQVELPARIEHVEALRFPLRRLLLELEGYLRGRGLGATRLRLLLFGEKKDVMDEVTLGTAAPTREAERLLGLFQERLTRHTLVQPVERLALHAEETAPFAELTADLLGDLDTAVGDIDELLDRLLARLGRPAVQGLACRGDHRPEFAWQYTRPGESVRENPNHPRRPLWLLPQPQRLVTRDNRPWLKTPLELLDGPERIQGGWWDHLPIARDYYIAQTTRHTRLWIFRELLTPRDWYLHGIFA